VATVEGTVSEAYLANQRIRASRYPDLTQAMLAVQSGEAEAVVYDQPILQYRNGELNKGGLRLLPGTFENQSYAFAVSSQSPLREPISQAILEITGAAPWQQTLQRYLGTP
jgi:ABC-type amino acid transport substrate-binding protein